MSTTATALPRETRVSTWLRHQEAGSLLEAPVRHWVAEPIGALIDIDEVELEALLASEPDEASRGETNTNCGAAASFWRIGAFNKEDSPRNDIQGVK